MKLIVSCLAAVLSFVYLSGAGLCAPKYLYSFKGGSDVSWPNWIWFAGGAGNGADDFGNPGWRSTSGRFMTNNVANWLPRVQSNNGYGQNNLAKIDTTNRAPGRLRGNCFKVYDVTDGKSTTGTVTAGSNLITVASPSIFKVGQTIFMPAAGFTVNAKIAAINGNVLTMVVDTSGDPAFAATASATNAPVYPYWMSSWFYLNGDSYGTSQLADASTNRLGFYLKTSGLVTDNKLTTSKPQTGNFHIGTYLCWPGGGATGQSCPTEANNQHYYHYLTIRDGAWLHVQLDRHPTHQRGLSGSKEPSDNPAFASYGKNYYENMNGFYAEIRYPQPQPTYYLLDQIMLWTAPQPENDISVNSVWVGYWPDTGKWEIGFMDDSFNATGYNNTSQSTFQIRYSVAPITNDNWNKAAIAIPEYWARTSGTTFKRPDTWSKVAWTRFSVPSSMLTRSSRIHFAIKDVSDPANGDGHASQSPLVKTIDYDLRPSPGNLGEGS